MSNLADDCRLLAQIMEKRGAYPKGRGILVQAADALATKDATIARLEAENERMREAISGALGSLDGEPEYHDQGMGCGLEDRNIIDRYEAMQHGWECAMERVYSENVSWAKDQLSSALSTIPDPAGGMPVEVK